MAFRVFITALAFFITLGIQVSRAEYRVSQIQYNQAGPQLGKLLIQFSGQVPVNPALSFKDNIIQLALPDTVVWPKIEKKISVTISGQETQIHQFIAYQFNETLARVRAILPYETQGLSDQVHLNVRNDSLELVYPIPNKALGNEDTNQIKDSALEKLNEKYLDSLINDRKNELSLREQSKAIEKKLGVEEKAPQSKKNIKKPTFSFMGYMFKILGLLALVLILFIGLAQVFKKKVLGRGKIGFLSNSQLVSIISSTYVAPKKSLLLVKAHNKVLLLSNAENGIHLISEINDITNVLKESEKEIAGQNFDSNLDKNNKKNNQDLKVKIKENILASENSRVVSPLSPELVSKDEAVKVRLSQQIKEKIKELKPLQ